MHASSGHEGLGTSRRLGNPLGTERIWLRHKAADPGKIALVGRYATGARLLDVRCAQGWYGQAAIQAGFEVTFTDVTCDVAPDLAPFFVEADAAELPFADESFDTVLLLDVLEHVADDDAALAEVFRVVARRVIVSVPHVDEPALHRYNVTYKHHIDKTHYREYSVESLLLRLGRAGFEQFTVSKAGAVRPDLIAEFIRWPLVERLVRWLVVRMWHVGVLRSDLHADLVVIADKARKRCD